VLANYPALPPSSDARFIELISGNPSFKTWEQDASKADKVLTGIWEATPGGSHSIRGTTFEFCHIQSGVVEI
jgi:uncharacterized cupin superfamily protein